MGELVELIAQANDNVLIRKPHPLRPEIVQEAWLLLENGTVTVVTDIHQQGSPHNAIAFTAAELRQIARMIPASS